MAPTLVVIRGNSGSGKTTTAREIRRRYGRGCALIEQDRLRRIILREHDSGPDPVAPRFITTMARTALESGYHVILEGILRTGRYGDSVRDLIAVHPGPAAVYYLDVSFDETVRRHLRRAEPIPVTPEQMRGWYQPLDVLGVPGERVVPEESSFEGTVDLILHRSGLATAAARTSCPARCPRCAAEASSTASA
ncbi:AAA family ATPase [Actinoplanes siamensis]|nr:AAA family ATPase [Actinoplanes siamensis]